MVGNEIGNRGLSPNDAMRDFTAIAGLFALMAALFALCGIVGSLPA